MSQPRQSSVPQKYRKKPVVIEAVQLGRDNAGELVLWINDHYVEKDIASMRGGPRGGSRDATVHIQTLEGVMRADVGDWIIRGVNHEFYPCKPGIFDVTYEAAE